MSRQKWPLPKRKQLSSRNRLEISAQVTSQRIVQSVANPDESAPGCSGANHCGVVGTKGTKHLFFSAAFIRRAVRVFEEMAFGNLASDRWFPLQV